MEKRAELTSKTLVTIILLIVGFIIVLFLFFSHQFSWIGRVDREVCHQSVIFRATLPAFAGAKEYVPLKCKTQKICFTSGIIGGKCKEFENTKGVWTVKVKKGEEGKKQIERTIAQEIVDCWSTMGEGKVSVFSQWLAETYGVGSVYPSCVICSRIAFDNASLGKAGIDLNKVDVMGYMMRYAVPGRDISYYDYLAGEGGKISVKDDIEIEDIKEVEKDGKKTPELSGEKGSFELTNLSRESIGGAEELAVLFMQVSAPEHLKTLKNTAITLLGGYGASFILAPKIMGKATAGASPWTLAILAIAGVYQQGNVAYNRAVTAGYCDDVIAGDEARQGCSVVRAVNYNAGDILEYCSVIESIP